LKKNYIIGLALILLFVVFIAAGAAGSESEVIVGSFGFFGVIALLPLFLYLVLSQARSEKTRIQKVKEIGSHERKEMLGKPSDVEECGMISGLDTVQIPSYKDEIDSDFIEGLRAEHMDIVKEKSKGFEDDTSDTQEEKSQHKAQGRNENNDNQSEKEGETDEQNSKEDDI
jgi:hypothetical protein